MINHFQNSSHRDHSSEMVRWNFPVVSFHSFILPFVHSFIQLCLLECTVAISGVTGNKARGGLPSRAGPHNSSRVGPWKISEDESRAMLEKPKERIEVTFQTE